MDTNKVSTPSWFNRTVDELRAVLAMGNAQHVERLVRLKLLESFKNGMAVGSQKASKPPSKPQAHAAK